MNRAVLALAGLAALGAAVYARAKSNGAGMPDYTIAPQYLPAPSARRSGQKMQAVKFVVAHDTGNPGSTARGNVGYYRGTAQSEKASAHIFVDDREIIECVPAMTTVTPEKAWHVRYNAPDAKLHHQEQPNDYAIGVEYCHGGSIDAGEAYRRYVWVIAQICNRYHLNPERDIIGHFQLDPGRKTDPVTGLATSGRTFEQLKIDVANALKN